ncbi:MAG TPA: C25 family cysteine peptidase [Thermoanaerobaculia bacterium]|nr:C25 family cysteine peptidase [Thermoanaerobaculia bacterium]
MSHSAASPVALFAVRRPLAALLAVALLGGPFPLRAASTGTTALHTPQGSDAGTPNGDYISDAGGLNTFYRYFIEVPPGTGRLTVEVWDADIGEGGAAEDTAGRDRDRDDGYDSQVDYTLIRPDGSTAATLLNCDDNTCNDSAWDVILNSTTAQNTAAGHWELRVDMDGANDINAIGIRAHDGTAGAGGTELNVYYDSHTQIGVNPSANGANTRSYALYPYITSGCSAAKNDFDFDNNSGNVGSMSFTSRNGTFTQTYASASLSPNNMWRRDTFSGWTSDTQSVGYGIWTGSLTINTYNNPGINGNYANVWLSNFQAAANPPTANPTTNAFRVYLPNDAGGAPVKPYLEQLLTHKSGVNPVGAGQTSRYQVTVRLVNPTPRPVVFSAANLVRTNVPGGGVVYAGNAAVTQGSITAQPAVNGTGNITWNPGTVAAGATVLLTYQVNVTPASAGQRLAVTPTPASGNGTRATFVDETGNTTQARATHTLGPVCELAVTAGLLTEAVVSGFHASPADGGGVLLEWTTASEAGTAGFYVQRWDRAARRWMAAGSRLLTSVQAPQGGTYRFVDEGASPLEPQVYRLEEVEAGGRRRVHGPFAAAVEWSRKDPRESAVAYERQAHRAARRAVPKALTTAGAVFTAQDGAHLSVRETGLYRLSNADVAAWLGVTPETAGTMIAGGRIALTRGGQAVAWYPDLAAAGSKTPNATALGLFFYGEAPPAGLYTDASVYRLQGNGRGVFMPTAPAGASPAAGGGTFQEAIHTERDAFPATVISLDPEADYWFWEFLQGGDPTYGQRTFTLDAPGRSGAGGGWLAVSLQGATASGVADEHQAAVALNGTVLGETRWTGITARQETFLVPPGILLESGNQVTVSAHTGAGAPYSIFYVDGFDLGYRRAFRAAGDALAFSAGGDGGSAQGTLTGFSAPGIRLIDVQNPLRPRWVTDAAVEPDPSGGYRLTLAPSPAARYLAAAPAAFTTPAAVRPWSAPALRSAANRAAYLVVAPAGLRGAAERLADLRRAQGLEAMVADLDQIMDEFNAGAPNPNAIRSFLTWARANWSVPPRYVALAGEGTVDYRNLLGYGESLVPPLMVQSQGGLFPSDNRLGDADGDGLPELAVGRIPVLSAAELDAYTAKIAAYESASSPDWAGSIVMLADAPDQGADFAADSERIAGQIPAPYSVDRIYLSSTPLADARARLLDGLGRGAAFVNYMGHGGLDRLSAAGLLTSGDVPGLANGSHLPVVTAMTCTVNRFAVPGVPSLGELLVKSAGGGAAAVWGPTGLSLSGEARLLAERFYHPAGEERLGDRILRAVTEFRALGGDPALPRIYDLLGDPALRLPLPAAAAPVPAGSGE